MIVASLWTRTPSFTRYRAVAEPAPPAARPMETGPSSQQDRATKKGDCVFIVNPNGSNGKTGKAWKKLLPKLTTELSSYNRAQAESMAEGVGMGVGVGVGVVNFGVMMQEGPQLAPAPPPGFAKEGGGGGGGEPIAAALGIDHPFPPHLEYAYPPPDGNILTNIVGALIAVPRFYTQVLHLMNKMNLPAPFRPALPTPPLPPPPPAAAAPPVPKRPLGDLSSGESELESSDEEKETVAADLGDDQAEGGLKKDRGKKRAKREPILGPAADKEASHEAAGVKSLVIPKPAAIKKKTPVLQIKIAPPKVSAKKVEEERNKAADPPTAEPLDAADEDLATASQEELEAGKIQASEMLSDPIFKKYDAGNPAPVLYIKNLAKGVVADDMFHIFGAFFSNKAEAKESLSVKVMQEGKMRGQAFVQWPSTELAKVALAGTHGYVWKGKPMVVQYGRNPAAAKPSTISGAPAG